MKEHVQNINVLTEKVKTIHIQFQVKWNVNEKQISTQRANLKGNFEQTDNFMIFTAKVKFSIYSLKFKKNANEEKMSTRTSK